MTRKETTDINKEYDPAYWDEEVEWLVPINMLNPGETEYTIQVNGHCFLMKRGEKVKVPRYVIENYNQQQRQFLEQYNTQKKYENVSLGEA